MFDYSEESYKFDNEVDYQNWLREEDWYQTIITNSGVVTKGKVRTDKRLEVFKSIDFHGKSVLDIGCNSGQYALFAKQMGAEKVVGIDINKKRIDQARVLSANEGYPVLFGCGGVDFLEGLGRFDIVFCFAVLTEISDVIGSLKLIANSIGERALIEMAIAKPIVYLSKNTMHFKKDINVSRLGRVAEFHRHKHAGWVVHPSIEIVADVFGKEFSVEFIGKGLRYDLIKVSRSY